MSINQSVCIERSLIKLTYTFRSYFDTLKHMEILPPLSIITSYEVKLFIASYDHWKEFDLTILRGGVQIPSVTVVKWSLMSF
jgi:hypothetical protein